MMKALLAAAALAMLAPVAAQATTLFNGAVDARSSVHGQGIEPRDPGSLAPIMVNLMGATKINVTATGLTAPVVRTPNINADGVGSNFSTNIDGLNGISGIKVDNRALFLVGVFVDSTNLPTTGSGPAKLEYSASDLAAPSFANLLLNQAFFIGDGLTGNGSGAKQVFMAPNDADKLLLGFLDGNSFNGPSSFYEDNRGALTATVSAVPVPAALPLLLAGLGGFAFFRRRG